MGTSTCACKGPVKPAVATAICGMAVAAHRSPAASSEMDACRYGVCCSLIQRCDADNSEALGAKAVFPPKRVLILEPTKYQINI